MRVFLLLGAVALNSLVRQGTAHPLCYYDDKPTDPDQDLIFCPAQEEGACCNDLEETISIMWYQAAFPEGSTATEECKDYYKQVSFVARIVGGLITFHGGQIMLNMLEHVLLILYAESGRAFMKVPLEAPG